MPPLNIPYENTQKIAKSVIRHVLEEKWIDTAVNHWENPAMIALFDIYMEWIPSAVEFDNIMCGKCRETVLQSWQQMKPYLMERVKN